MLLHINQPGGNAPGTLYGGRTRECTPDGRAAGATTHASPLVDTAVCSPTLLHTADPALLRACTCVYGRGGGCPSSSGVTSGLCSFVLCVYMWWLTVAVERPAA